jgi:hypothetical protein
VTGGAAIQTRTCASSYIQSFGMASGLKSVFFFPLFFSAFFWVVVVVVVVVVVLRGGGRTDD